jgi:RecA-family ATPase
MPPAAGLRIVIGKIQRGEVLHDSLRDLAAKMVKSGMNVGAAVNMLRGVLDNAACPRDDRWGDRYREIPGLVESAEGLPEKQTPSLPFINMSNWDNEPVPDQEWTVLNRIPRRQVALFTGEGAAGKSTIELHRSAAHVLDREWLGTRPELGPALFIDAEDDGKVIHRRLAAITKHFGVTFADLIKGGLHLISLTGQDAVLATASRSGKIEPTPLYKQLLEAVGDIKPVTTCIASSANVFAGNELDRSQVQQFISLLTRLAVLANGDMTLIAHPSLTGISSGSGISGNTQWHNAVRARFYLKGVKPEDGEEPDGDLREIVFKKNNYGPISEKIVLRYSDGLFLPVPGVTSLDRAVRDAKADDAFISILQRFTREGRNASHNKGPTYAPTLFIQEPEAAELKKDDLDAAMRRLFTANRIHVQSYRKNSQNHERIAFYPQPSAEEPVHG